MCRELERATKGIGDTHTLIPATDKDEKMSICELFGTINMLRGEFHTNPKAARQAANCTGIKIYGKYETPTGTGYSTKTS